MKSSQIAKNSHFSNIFVSLGQYQKTLDDLILFEIKESLKRNDEINIY